MANLAAEGKWVGIPYRDHGRTIEGADCWGLCMLWLREHGIDVPDYNETYGSADDIQDSARAILTGKAGAPCTEVPLEEADYGDIILLRLKGHPCHCGIVLGDRRMLHTLRGHNSAIERYDSTWFRLRVQGVFRWRR